MITKKNKQEDPAKSEEELKKRIGRYQETKRIDLIPKGFYFEKGKEREPDDYHDSWDCDN